MAASIDVGLHNAGRTSTTSFEGSPLASGLFTDSIGLPSAKSIAQVELRRAINAASGAPGGDDPSLGNIQSKALELCSADEMRRVKAGLQDGVVKARERGQHLLEAVGRVDRYQSFLQAKKRNRVDGGGHDRPGQRAGLGHVAKGGGRGASSSGEGSGSGTPKGAEKSKSGVVSKRIRTSLENARPEGRPSNLSVQRSSGVQERERESPRPGAGEEGWEKSKLMKGRRSATIKPDAAPVVSSANGAGDGEREQKGSGQAPRGGGGDVRSRPSEGHGFRSGPVHGSVSVQKAESVVQANGGGIRGGTKVESVDVTAQRSVGGLGERERLNGKGGAKPAGRDEGRPSSPGTLPKAKGARAPRSNPGLGNPSASMGRASPFGDARERVLATSPAKAPAPTGPTNRKRAAPSRSSSPPVASWGSSRPQKMQRVRRAHVVPPVSIAVPLKDEANGSEEVGPGVREVVVSVATPSSRVSLGGAGGGGSSVKRGSGQGVPVAKAERSMAAVGLVESEEYMEEGQKMKGRRKKQEDEDGEQRASGAGERCGGVVVTTSRGMVLGVDVEMSGGGDGVRRQGRTGRAPMTGRVVMVGSSLEKAEGGAVNVKATRVGRPTEAKSAGPGRPKSGGSDRKISSRPRRLPGNNGSEILGEEDDDHEHLGRVVQQVVDLSATACPKGFWTQMEPYFSYLTSDDLSFLQRQMALAGEIGSNTGLKSPLTGDRMLDSDEAKNANNLREQSSKERNLRRGRGGGWYDKVFPLSQRLLSALISEREDDGCADRDSESPAGPSSHSEMDYDRRDAEGESDVDNLKTDPEWWSGGGVEGGYSEGSPTCGGAGDPGGDDILAGYDGLQSGGADWCSGVDDEAGSGRQLENGSMDWDERYRRMSLDDRLLVELRSIGLVPEHQPREENEGEVDDIGEEIRRLQAELDEQVSTNKERLCRLESSIVERREVDERAREKLAMDKLLELAYKKKTGGRSNKGAAAKGARAAALAFAKRVLARVHRYEGGHGFITDPALRDRLFCVPPSLVESTPDAAMDAVKDAGAVATTAERLTSPMGAGGAMLMGVSGGQRMEDVERSSFVGQSPGMEFSHLKDEGWPSREVSLDDLSGYPYRDMMSSGLGGTKGKRSERERDAAKAKDGGRSGPSGAKGERKTKTKPRQKTGPLLKAVEGLVPRGAGEEARGNAKAGRSSKPGQGHGSYFHAPMRREDSGMQGLSMLEAEPSQMVAEPPVDLTALPLPGMDDIGSWLDFGLDDPMQQADDLSMGLDCPMDDLSGLMMM